MFAEVELPEGTDVGGFGLHPALLDAALHTLGLLPGEGTRLPFLFGDVTLHATGATALRVRVTTVGTDTVSVLATDTTGAPVATLGTVTVRTAESPAAAGCRLALRADLGRGARRRRVHRGRLGVHRSGRRAA